MCQIGSKKSKRRSWRRDVYPERPQWAGERARVHLRAKAGQELEAVAQAKRRRGSWRSAEIAGAVI
jgi:hypothetical protein